MGNLRDDLFQQHDTGYNKHLSDGDKYIFDFDFQVIRPLLCFALLLILL